jgi:hypothetical protein
MIRPRLTREQRAERFRATRERWAVTLEPETRAVFERLLDEGDRLVEAGWRARQAAWALVKRPEAVP